MEINLFHFDVYTSNLLTISFPWKLDFSFGLNIYSYFLLGLFVLMFFLFRLFPIKERGTWPYMLLGFISFVFILLSFDYIIMSFFLFLIVLLYFLYVIFSRGRTEYSLKGPIWIFSFFLVCLLLSIGIVGIHLETSSMQEILRLVENNSEGVLFLGDHLYLAPFLFEISLFGFFLVLPYVSTLYFNNIRKSHLLLFFNFFLFPTIALIFMYKFWPFVFLLKSSYLVFLVLSLVSALIFSLFALLNYQDLEKRLNFFSFSLLSFFFMALSSASFDYAIQLLFSHAFFIYFLFINASALSPQERNLSFTQFELFLILTFMLSPLYFTWKIFTLSALSYGLLNTISWTLIALVSFINIYLLFYPFFVSCFKEKAIQKEHGPCVIMLFLFLMVLTPTQLLDLWPTSSLLSQGTEKVFVFSFANTFAYFLFVVASLSSLVMSFLFVKNRIQIESLLGFTKYLTRINSFGEGLYHLGQKGRDFLGLGLKRPLRVHFAFWSHVQGLLMKLEALAFKVLSSFEGYYLKTWTTKIVDARTLLGIALAFLFLILLLFNYRELLTFYHTGERL